MPGRIVLLTNGKYQVTWDGEITAKGTTEEKAKAQLRLLRAIENKKHPGSAFLSRVKEKRNMARRKKVKDMVPGRRVCVLWSQLTDKQKMEAKRRFTSPYQIYSGKYKYFYYLNKDGTIDRRRFG